MNQDCVPEQESTNKSMQTLSESSQPKLSVLMPLFNERWTLEEIVDRVLAVEIPADIELIVVDDGSEDGSWELLNELAAGDRRIRAFQHERNQGKGAAIRTAIDKITGDYAVIQDADLEYDPEDYHALLQPLLEDEADAVFGSRFTGNTRRVLCFWHSMLNRGLTCLSNMVNDLNLTDMETCYKMVRTDVLRNLRLKANSFTLEPELTCRLAQYSARIYEVPISYHGRTFDEGKKIRPIDGVKAIWEIFRSKYIDPQFTHHSGLYRLASAAKSGGYNRWILGKVKRFLGNSVLEVGSGIGSVSQLLAKRERLVLLDNDPLYDEKLKQRFGRRKNIEIVQADLTNDDEMKQKVGEPVDTVLCTNLLQSLEPDQQVLESFHDTLNPDGHCVIVVPAGNWLYTRTDTEPGQTRCFAADELAEQMSAAGFKIVIKQHVAKLGPLSWFVSGRVFEKQQSSPSRMAWFNRLSSVVKTLEYLLPTPAMSLIMVGQKPVAAADAVPATEQRATAA